MTNETNKNQMPDRTTRGRFRPGWVGGSMGG